MRARESAEHDADAVDAEPASPTGKVARLRRFARRRGLPALLAAALIGIPGTVAASRMRGTDNEQPGRETADWGASILDPEDDEFVQANWERAMDIEPIYDEGLDLEDEDMEPLVGALGANGIPEVALDAYYNAEDAIAGSDPDGGVPWSLIAAIGRVESNHGRFGGAELLANGDGTKPIRGVRLDGSPGVALIRDTDDCRLDDDCEYDRAVGPMQFIPSSWPPVATDCNGDSAEDPDNIYDAACGTAVYLAATEGDLYDDQGAREEAVFRYNHSEEYVRTVLSLAEMYEEGGVEAIASGDWSEDFGDGDALDADAAEAAAAGELGPELPEPPGAAPAPAPAPSRPAPAPRPAPRPTTPTTGPAPRPTTTTTTPPSPTTVPDRPGPGSGSTTTTTPGSTTTTTPGSTTTTTTPGSTTSTTVPAPEPPDDVPVLPEPPTDPISVGWPQGMNELPPAQLPPPPAPPTTQPPATVAEQPPACPTPAAGADQAGAAPADPGSTETTAPSCEPVEGAPASTGAGGAGTDGASTDGEAAGSTTASPDETSAP